MKTNKTAGTSMEIALSAHTGESDVITPLKPPDELKRFQTPRARLPQNFSLDSKMEEQYREAVRTGEESAIRQAQKRSSKDRYVFQNHMTIAQARAKLDADFFQHAFKFTIERHPFDRIISMAYWKCRNRLDADIAGVIDELLDRRAINNTDYYLIDGKPAVNFFIRYENLAEDVAKVGEIIGAPELQAHLPQTKHEHRRDRRSPKDVLSEVQRKRILRQCRTEFELFGYET